MRQLHLFGLASLLLAVLLALPIPAALAQESGTAPVTGDAQAASLGVVRQFLEQRNNDVLADNVTFQDPTVPEPVEGRENVAGLQGLFFGDAFTNQVMEPVHYYVVDDTVIAEFIYMGEQTGDFLGTGATGAQVVLPMAGIFRVEGDTITNLRLYYDIAALNNTLGVTGGLGAAAPVLPAAGIPDVDVDDVYEADGNYLDQVVSVAGEVDRVISDQAFTLQDQDLVDLDGQEWLLVLAGPEGSFPFEFGEGDSLTVTGRIRAFDLDALESELGRSLDRDTLGEYQDWLVLVTDVTDQAQ